VSPPSSAGAVDVTVTTPGSQSATAAADRFTYTAPQPPTTASCIVPKLKGKELKEVRKALTQAACKLGTVKGQQSKAATVKKQSAKPGAELAPGSKVNVTVK
jgi:beta-lactam-binding protein with PASTA domain